MEIILRMERSAIEGVETLTLLTESLMEDAVVDPVEPGRTLGTRGGLGVASWSDLRTCGGVVGGDRRIMLRAGCSPRDGGGGGAASSFVNLRSAWRWPWSAPSAAAGAPYGESMLGPSIDRGSAFPTWQQVFPKESVDVSATGETRAAVRRGRWLAQQKFRAAARPSVRRLGPIHSRRDGAKKSEM